MGISLTAAIWIGLAIGLCLASLFRPVWAVALYFQTFFAAPHMWWWGRDVPSARYALWSGILLLLAVALIRLQSVPDLPSAQRIRNFAIAMLLNAILVHLLLAADSRVSLDVLIEFAKFLFLIVLLSAAIKDRDDFNRTVAAIALGAAYIGWEVTVNKRGDFSGSRLEGVGAPAASTANSLANLMLIALPLAGSLLLRRSWKWRVVSVIAAPLILNVLLLCNSRGAFLGLIGTGAAFFVAARGETRKRAAQSLGIACVALYLLLGDPRIFERFTTTFTGSEQRDSSAASRILFWEAGLRLLNDHPLGAGGGAFKFALGQRYLAQLSGVPDAEARSLHNGYLTEATDWGIQGLLLKLITFGLAITAAYKTGEAARKEGRIADSLVGLSVVTTAVGFLIHSFFGAFLDHEWGYWILALLIRYAAIYKTPEAVASGHTTEQQSLPTVAA